ncbi:hypothetical protein GF362_03445 [Candidatus Dojkabacteria bacterium]|nr:hypothetical protein [Candidatus Dojkabacteria bacterium]
MKKYTLYGNCQTLALKPFLDSSKEFTKNFEYIPIERVHKMHKEDLDKFYEILPKIELLIHIPVSQNYKGNSQFSTQNILNNVPKKCISILFPVCFFRGYNPELFYLKDLNNNKLTSDIDYHDINILKAFIKQNSKLRVLQNNQFSEKQMEEISNESIKELASRENNLFGTGIKTDISISQFIKSRFKDQRLFYTINHPSKYLLTYITKQVFKILNINTTIFSKRIDPLASTSYPIYKNVFQSLNLKFENNSIYKIKNKIYTKKRIIKKYFNYYKDLPTELLEMNVKRYEDKYKN